VVIRLLGFQPSSIRQMCSSVVSGTGKPVAPVTGSCTHAGWPTALAAITCPAGTAVESSTKAATLRPPGDRLRRI
jgi:hypothetical protein